MVLRVDDVLKESLKGAAEEIQVAIVDGDRRGRNICWRPGRAMTPPSSAPRGTSTPI